MTTHLLTWNPLRFDWTDLATAARTATRTHRLEGDWSCGNTKRIGPGARFFQIRLGLEPRGIFASGVVTSSPHSRRHWSGEPGKRANYVDVIWDSLLYPGRDRILPMAYLKQAFDTMHWEPQTSGIQIPGPVAIQLEKAWAKLVGHRQIPAVPVDRRALEGLQTETVRYVRGRSRHLRDLALDRARGICSACQVNYSRVLNGDGTRVLQVHHRRQLAASDAPRITSLTDLAAVCANCHMLIHINPKQAATVESLRSRIANDRRARLNGRGHR